MLEAAVCFHLQKIDLKQEKKEQHHLRAPKNSENLWCKKSLVKTTHPPKNCFFSIRRTSPDLDINWKNQQMHGCSLLQYACSMGCLVKLLNVSLEIR